jgi:hypothetical protein
MAASAGHSVLVKVSTTTIGFTDNVSYTTNMGSAETTTFGDTWKANIPTIRDVAFTCSGSYDKSDSGQDTAIWTELLSGDGAIADLRIYIGANFYSGAAVLTSASISATASDKVSYSASFIGNGTWAYS